MQRSLDTVIDKYITDKLLAAYLANNTENKFCRMLDAYMDNLSPAQLSIKVALALEGIHEEGQDNCGALVESIQRTASGAASKEPWCMSLQQVIEAYVEKYKKVISSFPQGESCVLIYDSANKNNDCVVSPDLGDIIIWRSISTVGTQVTELMTGHCGRVVATGDVLQTIEGNTSSGIGLEREGDGVYKKFRFQNTYYKTMRMLGFVRPQYKQKEG